MKSKLEEEQLEYGIPDEYVGRGISISYDRIGNDLSTISDGSYCVVSKRDWDGTVYQNHLYEYGANRSRYRRRGDSDRETMKAYENRYLQSLERLYDIKFKIERLFEEAELAKSAAILNASRMYPFNFTPDKLYDMDDQNPYFAAKEQKEKEKKEAGAAEEEKEQPNDFPDNLRMMLMEFKKYVEPYAVSLTLKKIKKNKKNQTDDNYIENVTAYISDWTGPYYGVFIRRYELVMSSIRDFCVELTFSYNVDGDGKKPLEKKYFTVRLPIPKAFDMCLPMSMADEPNTDLNQIFGRENPKDFVDMRLFTSAENDPVPRHEEWRGTSVMQLKRKLVEILFDEKKARDYFAAQGMELSSWMLKEDLPF